MTRNELKSLSVRFVLMTETSMLTKFCQVISNMRKQNDSGNMTEIYAAI